MCSPGGAHAEARRRTSNPSNALFRRRLSNSANEGGRISPLFVYGTLQTGFRNHDCVEPFIDAARTRVARVSGVALVHFQGGYPGLYGRDRCKDVPGLGSSDLTSSMVEGELLYPKDTQAAADALAACDALEQYHGPGAENNMYERSQVVAYPIEGLSLIHI